MLLINRKKGRYLTQSYDKSSYTNRQIQKAKWQHKHASKYFDYTTIADLGQSNESHQTGMVKPVYGMPTFPLTATAVSSK